MWNITLDTLRMFSRESETTYELNKQTNKQYALRKWIIIIKINNNYYVK
jgi:hypothetical protein